MNWNPLTRIAVLEDKAEYQSHVIGQQSMEIEHLQQKINRLEHLLNPYAAAPVRSEGEPVFTKAEVASEAEQRRLKRREYQRAWYAKQRTKSKQREYNAAYRARKKAEAAAALAIGGTE